MINKLNEKPKTLDGAIDQLDLALSLYNSGTPDLGATVSTGFDDIKRAVFSNAQESTTSAAHSIESLTQPLLNNFRNMIEPLAAGGVIAAEQVNRYAEVGIEKATLAAREADREVRSNPWLYIGSAALGMFTLGLLLGRSQPPETVAVEETEIEGVPA